MEMVVKYYSNRDGNKEYSHEYKEQWEETELFCPKCGAKTVWAASEGNYYAGCEHLCTTCEHSSYLDDVGFSGDNEQGKQRLVALKQNVTDELRLWRKNDSTRKIRRT